MYPDMLNVFAFIPTLTFHVLFTNDFLIVLGLFPFAEPPRLWAGPSADILILNLEVVLQILNLNVEILPNILTAQRCFISWVISKP